MRGAARPNCHTLALSHLAVDRGKAASIPGAARPHCILQARDLEKLALVFGLCRWSANFGRLLVVYHRIVQISRLNLACAVPSPTRMTSTTFESRYGSSLGPGKYQILALAVPLRVNVCVVVNVV